MVKDAPFNYTLLSKQSDPAGATSLYYALKSRNVTYLNAFLEKFNQYQKEIAKDINQYLDDAITSYGSDVVDFLLTHFKNSTIHYNTLITSVLDSPEIDMINVLREHNLYFSHFYSSRQLEEKVIALLKNNSFNIATFLIQTEPNLERFLISDKKITKYFSKAISYNEFEAVDYFIKKYNKNLSPTNSQLIAIIENAILSYSEDKTLLKTVVENYTFTDWDARGIFDTDLSLLEMIIEEDSIDLTNYIISYATLTPEQIEILLNL
jgi:hypothetical protein